MIFSVLTFTLVSAQSQNGSPTFPYEKMESTANAYFAAYSKVDVDKMLSMFADSVSYVDETFAGSPNSGGTPIKMEGKATVKSTFGEFMTSVIQMEFKEEHRFFSGNQGIFRGQASIHYKGSIVQKPDEEVYVWSAPYVVVLTFEEGKIIRVNDYLDYPHSTFEPKS